MDTLSPNLTLIAARLRAVVFDLDGTLVDSAPDLGAALNRLLAAEGRREVTLDEVKLMIGNGVRMIVRRGFRATGDDVTDDVLDGLVERYVADYERNSTDLTTLYPAAEDTIAALHTAGVRAGICTNKPHRASVTILKDFGVDHLFGVVVGGDSTPRRKPDPLPLLTAMEALGAAADQAVYVGDSEVDVEAARAAGVPVIALRHGYSRRPIEDVGADRVIDGFAALGGALASLL